MVLRFGPLAAAGMISIFPDAVPADAAARLDAHLSALDTVSARFEQRVFDEQHNLFEETGGTVLIDRPGRFRFDYEDPPQLIVGDGVKVWIYDRRARPGHGAPRRRRARLDPGGAAGLRPAGGGGVPGPGARRRRRVRLVRPRAEGGRRHLRPHPARVLRRGAATHGASRPVRPDHPGSISTTSVAIPAVPAGAFAFVPPAGVDVIVADP